MAEAKAKQAGDYELVLDFTQVSQVSLSFAEAFVARLFAERADLRASAPKLKGLSPSVAAAVNFSLSQRPQVLAALAIA